MKVVLFCGGKGTRLRDYSETIPKPMVRIGYRPILWNLMKYYAHFGHKDFVLALGYKADKIKDYFIRYDETISNDFIYTKGGKGVELLNSDIEDWRITFVDTGINSNIGMRLLNVRDHLAGEETFLANYADGLTNMHLPTMIDQFQQQPDKIASFMTYKPTGSFHTVRAEKNGLVTSILPISKTKMWLNTGFFLFKQEIFDYIKYGEELVEEPFQRLIESQKLMTYGHRGFWQQMDTFKDKMYYDDMENAGDTPWKVWETDLSKEIKPAHDPIAI